MKHLEQMLSQYFPEPSIRKAKLKEILTQLKGKTSLQYPLSETHSLILSKNERRLNRLRKYENSPFPLLSNLTFFSFSVGEYNTALQQYGIQSRNKESSTNQPSQLGTLMYVVEYQSINGRGNKYLRQSYRKLQTYRDTGQNNLY